MYKYEWDAETGGLVLMPELERMSLEPRPVYYRELDILGFDKHWNYAKDDSVPLMWATANNYIYRGRLVAKTKGGALYTTPELEILEEPEPNGQILKPVDIAGMTAKNAELMETLEQDTIQKIYNTFVKYRNKVDVFYVAFSGGKDSVVTLDLVQRALPHDEFVVLFGDTGMEFPDTYDLIEHIREFCQVNNISFFQSKSQFKPKTTWNYFGPPSTMHRWCCSVHKTSPQIKLLRQITQNPYFTGMAYTGVRASESVARSKYSFVSKNEKHYGQYICNCILQWSSLEIFLHIYRFDLLLNAAYKKGHVRVGCLVCPNSKGKAEYFRNITYTKEVDEYIGTIKSTNVRSNYSQAEMNKFLDAGYWKLRKTGRELNFGQDKFEIIDDGNRLIINVFEPNFSWLEWGKTIGNITSSGLNHYTLKYREFIYHIQQEFVHNTIRLTINDLSKSQRDTRFKSLFRSVIIKSLYCIQCGVCETECKSDCIHMDKGITIGDNCIHCHKCHEVKGCCLRYGSIINRISEGNKVSGLGKYFTFGMRADWLNIYFSYHGESDFWLTDGDGIVANTKKDAFMRVMRDAGMIAFKKNVEGDKYTKNKPTKLAIKLEKYGAYSTITWGMMLTNLAYTALFNWLIMNLQFNCEYTPDVLNDMLKDVMEGDTKGLGRRNVISSLKVFLAKTPLSMDGLFADADILIKETSNGNETMKFNSFRRGHWQTPDPRVILYSLYKFAEACGGIYQFSLATLLDDEIEREGISPTRIFGLDKDTMIPLLNGLSANYPEYISVSFTLGMDSITLRNEKTSEDVLNLF